MCSLTRHNFLQNQLPFALLRYHVTENEQQCSVTGYNFLESSCNLVCEDTAFL
jgi:hypothetical protein